MYNAQTGGFRNGSIVNRQAPSIKSIKAINPWSDSDGEKDADGNPTTKTTTESLERSMITRALELQRAAINSLREARKKADSNTEDQALPADEIAIA